MSTELNQTIEQIGSAFEAFKAANNDRLAEIEKKSAADVLTSEKVENIEAAISELSDVKTRLEQVENRKNRRKEAQEEADEAQLEYKSAFEAVLRNERDREAQQRLYDAQKALNTTTNSGADSGHAVPEQIARDIMDRVRDLSPMRQIATVESTNTPDYKKLINMLGSGHAWAAEGGTISASDTPTLREVAPTFGKLYAYPSATEESLQDPFFSVENWLVNDVSQEFALGEGTAFISGNGTNRPTGLLNGTPVATADGARAAGVLQYVPTGAAAAWTDEDVIIDTVYSLQATYRSNARWLMSKNTLATVRKLKDGDGMYLWQPGLQAGQPNLLAGYAVLEDETMPDIAANAFCAAFGDFRAGYLIVDRVGLSITRDEVTAPGLTKWYIRRRLGGVRMEDRAIKLVKVAST